MPNKRKTTVGAGVLACGALASVMTIILIVRHASAQVPQPGLTISQTDSNRFQITITNSVGYANYEIYRRTALPDLETIASTGSLGQAVFNVTNVNSVKIHEFFRAAVGSDWDGDGIPNLRDGQPSSTNGGALTITIDSPASNGNVP